MGQLLSGINGSNASGLRRLHDCKAAGGGRAVRVTIVAILSNVLAFTTAVAQNSPPQAQTRAAYAGQSWTGLLVADGCRTGVTSPSDAEADLSTTDRVTTPAVDDAGVRGASPAAQSSGGMKVPFTGDIASSRNDREDPGWRKAKRQAAHLDSACRTDAQTTRFALLLPDGRELRVDQLGNEKIAARLKTEPPAKPRILRVVVTGKIQNGAIAVDAIDF